MATGTSNRTAIVVLSDPEDGGAEANGRTFNPLAFALDLDQGGPRRRALGG